MINSQTIQALTSWPAFQANSKQLARELNISREDSCHELLIELLDHRFHDVTDEDIQMAIDRDDLQLKAKLKYARKDITRRQRHQQETETEKAKRLTPVATNDFIHLDPSQRSPDDLQQVVKLLPTLFTNGQTRQWVESVLTTGRQESMVTFGQSDKQFNSKLRKVVSYCHSHPMKTQGLMASRQDSRLQKELATLNEFTRLVESGADDSELSAWVYDHKDTAVMNKLVDMPAIKSQGGVLNDFAHSGHDRYAFVDRVYQRIDELENELADR